MRKKLVSEAAGISFEVREWSNVIYHLLEGVSRFEKRLIVDGQEWPEQFEKFSVDYFVIDFNDWTNGYLDETSGYDKDGNYVVHIMVLNQFRNHPYMKTILNHELKHAYQDWQRRRKGYEGVFATKEVKNIYTHDFIKVVKDKIKVGLFFKEILKSYYLLTNLEMNAFMENVYDGDQINDYKRMIKRLTDYDALRAAYYEDPDNLEKDWQTLKSLDLPFIKKYKTYTDFLTSSTDYFRKRSKEILKKIEKVERIHKLNESLEQQTVCNLVSPKPKNGQYLTNKEVTTMIEKIQSEGNNQITDEVILKKFNDTVNQFKKDIGYLDINNDTVDTYLHKLRTLLNC